MTKLTQEQKNYNNLSKKFELKEIKSKDEARQIAIDFQIWVSRNSLSYGELAEYNNFFMTIGKKFNLIKEFKENGII